MLIVIYLIGPFLLSISVFVVVSFLHYLIVFGSARQIKLATRQLLGARKEQCIVTFAKEEM